MNTSLVLCRDFGYGNCYPVTGRTRDIYNVSELGVPNDSITSLKVAPFTQVELYDNVWFGGEQLTISGPVEIPDLRAHVGSQGRGMNDRVTSLKFRRIEPSPNVKMQCCQGQKSAYECGEYVPGSVVCTNAILEYCTTHMREDVCKRWCQANPSQCDATVINYCRANPTDPFCTCINSPANTKGIINPKCVDKKCLETGYLTTSMRETNCPAQIDCSITANLGNSGVILNNSLNIAQNCGQGGGGAIGGGGATGGTTGTWTPVGGAGSPQQPGLADRLKSTFLNGLNRTIYLVQKNMFIVFLLILLLAIIIAAIVASG